MTDPFSGAPVRCTGGVQIYCSNGHSHKVDALKWRISSTDELGLVVQGNGQPKYYLHCPRCGHSSSQIPKHVANHLLTKGMRPTRTRHNDPMNYPGCSYRDCPNPGRHWHHTSPRNTFTDYANWPVIPFCEQHHTLWHQTMDGYRWNARTPERAPEAYAYMPDNRMLVRYDA